MKLDLRKDQKTIAKHIAERVRDYPMYVNNGPGEDEDPISLITLGFAFDQSGWIAQHREQYLKDSRRVSAIC